MKGLRRICESKRRSTKIQATVREQKMKWLKFLQINREEDRICYKIRRMEEVKQTIKRTKPRLREKIRIKNEGKLP